MRQKCNAGHTDLLSGVFPHTNTSLAAGVRIAGVRPEIPKEYKIHTGSRGVRWVQYGFDQVGYQFGPRIVCVVRLAVFCSPYSLPRAPSSAVKEGLIYSPYSLHRGWDTRCEVGTMRCEPLPRKRRWEWLDLRLERRFSIARLLLSQQFPTTRRARRIHNFC